MCSKPSGWPSISGRWVSPVASRRRGSGSASPRDTTRPCATPSRCGGSWEFPPSFNFLGPLANPARVRRQVVGVGDPAMAEKMTRVLAAGGSSHVLVVFGADGLDELSTTGPSTMYEYREDPGGGGGGGAGGSGGSGGSLEVRQVLPGELGLAPARLADLLGGDVDTNARMARKVLGGERGAAPGHRVAERRSRAPGRRHRRRPGRGGGPGGRIHRRRSGGCLPRPAGVGVERSGRVVVRL